jgi:hypothetical protein
VPAGGGGEGRGEGGVEAGRVGYEATQRTSRWCGTAGRSRAEKPQRLETPRPACAARRLSRHAVDATLWTAA